MILLQTLEQGFSRAQQHNRVQRNLYWHSNQRLPIGGTPIGSHRVPSGPIVSHRVLAGPIGLHPGREPEISLSMKGPSRARRRGTASCSAIRAGSTCSSAPHRRGTMDRPQPRSRHRGGRCCARTARRDQADVAQCHGMPLGIHGTHGSGSQRSAPHIGQ